MSEKNEWVRDGLQRRGYRQKDLAVAWSSQQASISRFIKGEELQDPPLSKAVSLARRLGITLDELAKGLGQNGVIVEPTIEGASAPTMSLGTISFSAPYPGVARLEMRKDLSPKAAQEIIAIVTSDSVMSPPPREER